jgi:propanol-preferring alcohol dehydrogenase
VIRGHQVVGVVEGVQRLPTLESGELQRQEALDSVRVGVAWIASACGHCQYCRSGQENLCAEFKATGRDINGGYAQYMSVRADFVHPIPDGISDSEAAPLLCAGAVGYRALKLCNLQDGQSLGLMGFGGSNHIVLKVAKHKCPNSEIFVFSRNPQEREFATSLGAAWAGAIDEIPPAELDAVIDTTPVWLPDMEALKRLKPGGRLVINAIRKEEADKEVLLQLDYASHLWMEKEIKSVANVTRQDVREFLQLAAEANIKPEYQEYELAEANQDLLQKKQGKISGAKVLRVTCPCSSLFSKADPGRH